MRRWTAALLLFAAIGLTITDTPQAAAQPAKLPAPEEETFLTADGIQLRGLFHATAKNPNSAPIVILLYAPGPDRDMTKGDWAALANRLNTEGYHVFRFDWRGHGKSTDIKDTEKFWTNNYSGRFNQKYVKGGPPKKPLKNDILYKDLGNNAAAYTPMYLNDLAAVRVHLDTKNDNKTINTSSIYVIGAETAATLGMAWLAAEWQRQPTYPTPNQLGGFGGMATYEYVPQRLIGGLTSEAGSDFSGAVWLSPSKPVTNVVTEATIKKWAATAPKIRENNPMLFLYGDTDRKGKDDASFFFNEVLVAQPKKGSALNPLEQTFLTEVKGGKDLKGVKLLDPALKLDTEDKIIKFLAAIQKERAKLPSKNRKYDTPYYIDVRFYGINAP